MVYRIADPVVATDPIEREIERIRRIRWLDPEPELHELGPEGVAWLRDAAEEHARLVGRHLEGGTQVDPRVVTARGMEEACLRFSNEWDIDDPLDWALERLWRDPVVDELESITSEVRATGVLRERIEAAVSESQDRSQPWARTLGSHWIAERPGVMTALAHLGWMAAKRTDGSPWSAVLSCWERGVWPLPLPNGGLLFYVPVVHERALVADPAHPDAGPKVERETVYVDRTDVLTDPFEIPPPKRLESQPDVAGYGPLPRIVQITSVEWPERTPWPRFEPESWCRRLLRRFLA